MQHEVTKPQKLLNEQGIIEEPGWARSLLWEYNRKAIKSPAFKIKEWDYYLVVNDHYGAAFTLSDLGYAGMISVSILDLDEGYDITDTIVTPFPLGRYKLPADSGTEGITEFRNKRVHLRYTVKDRTRRIQCRFNEFDHGKTLTADIMIRQPETESICIATPWVNHPKAFYYNQKINCMPARGKVSWGSMEWTFSDKDTFGILDWGRGVWTYDNTWYWGTGNAMVHGKPFGFNIGYGFSDRSCASENVIVYDGKIHKLEDIVFAIPETFDGQKLYTDPWQIVSSDHRFDMDFIPVFDRRADMNFKLIQTDQHQVFGRLSGTAVLDDGTKLVVKDVVSALEVVHNRY